MKNISQILLLFVICFTQSCKKDILTLQEVVINQKEWNATKFIVQSKNTMPPENSPILDAPVSFVQLNFIDAQNLTIELALKYATYSDKSGILPMTYILDEKQGTIDIKDNNEWTRSASFTGIHKINLADNILTIEGKLGDTLDYQLILK